ncbi:5'(3')-deoxyribonucleotidase, mitochondrial isoform X5 [Equus asinus]|uniref:5'(3')-deoxyribonucleotidase, mitochondrial isoform X5 n=1 Tax=Equus asinus TaxID=9793 RepID=UPI0038F7AD21
MAPPLGPRLRGGACSFKGGARRSLALGSEPARWGPARPPRPPWPPRGPLPQGPLLPGGHGRRPEAAGRRSPGPGARSERPRGAMIRLGGWCARRPRGAAGPAGRRWAAGGPAGRAGGRALRVLVDMDGVLADFEGGFLRKYRARFPDQPFIALEDRRGFWVSEQYGRLQPGLSVSIPRAPAPRGWEPAWPWEKAISIWESENFFFDLEPLPGAVEAVKQMANLEKDTSFSSFSSEHLECHLYKEAIPDCHG